MDDKAASLRGIVKGFNIGNDHFNILNDLNFNIEKGESVAVVGTSGIGKSTLLHMLGTLDHPDEGIVEIAGKTIVHATKFKNVSNNQLQDKKLAEFRNSNIGFVFQFHHLLPEFTALENTMMPLLIGSSKENRGSFLQNITRKIKDPFSKQVIKDSKDFAIEILEKVGLKHRLMHMPGELSGGEQQRVAIARAIIKKPSILLADEPTGNLDIKTSEKIHALLDELNQDLNMTIVVVTHNPDLASVMKRKVTLSDGQIKEI
ncbi:MAG: ABC transporter ATP-binding protein [Desulfobacterales bacterium]|nr:ABC transporter ATP-binding protein [Desulfobacterales bacterium]MCP4160949.1 ABC transporter ATP-binding protein [Deltaproteobacteria bacterium]